jgi:hypothetical protein
MEDVEEHRRVLRDLVSGSGDISVLARQLAGFQGWDVEPLVTLGGPDIVSILERYLRGDLSAADVVMWADALEMRDDVDYGDDAENGVLTAVHQLANRGMGACPATPKEARRLIAELKTQPDPGLRAQTGLMSDSTGQGPQDIDEESRFVRWASSPDGGLFEIRGATSFDVIAPLGLESDSGGATLRRVLGRFNKALLRVQRPGTETTGAWVSVIPSGGELSVFGVNCENLDEAREVAVDIATLIGKGALPMEPE